MGGLRLEPSLPDSSPCPGISRGRMEGEGGCQWEYRGSWGASQTEYPECQLDPMTACELPEKKMARAQKVGEGSPNTRRTLFWGDCLLGAGKAPGNLHTEKQPMGAGQGAYRPNLVLANDEVGLHRWAWWGRNMGYGRGVEAALN